MRLARKNQIPEIAELAPQAMGLGVRPIELTVDRQDRKRNLGQIKRWPGSASGTRRSLLRGSGAALGSARARGAAAPVALLLYGLQRDPQLCRTMGLQLQQGFGLAGI